jgi:ferric-dicitrate binding protein FerR (iron transport regulator)
MIGSAEADDAAAGVGPWLAEYVRGTVRVRASGQAAAWQTLADEAVLAADSEVRTGADGIAVLANGVDRIRLSPNSHVVLPAPIEEAGLLTLIRQKLGRVFFDVGARPERRFEVDAPFLVVLVKGTQFTVHANYVGNSVEVDEGTVEVRTRDEGDGQGSLVTAGETGSIRAGGNAINVAPSEGNADSNSGSTNRNKGGGESRSEGAPGGRASGSGGPGGGGEGDGGGDGDGGDGDGGGGGGSGGGGGDGDGCRG